MKRSIRAGQYVRRAMKFEARIKKHGDKEVIEGYASVFGSKNAHDEVMMPGAFAQSVRELQESGRPAIHLLHHDERLALGPSEIAEDSTGLHIRTAPLSNRTAQEAREEIEAGILNALSIGFSYRKGGAEWIEDDPEHGDHIRVTGARLFEHSSVRWGSDPMAMAGLAQRSRLARSLEGVTDDDELLVMLVRRRHSGDVTARQCAMIDELIKEITNPAPAAQSDKSVLSAIKALRDSLRG